MKLIYACECNVMDLYSARVDEKFESAEAEK